MQACTGLQKFLPVGICQGVTRFNWFKQQLLVLIRANSFLQDAAPWKSCPSSEVSEVISCAGRKGNWAGFPKDLKPCQDCGLFSTKRANNRLLSCWLLFLLNTRCLQAKHSTVYFVYLLTFCISCILFSLTRLHFFIHIVATFRLLCITISKREGKRVHSAFHPCRPGPEITTELQGLTAALNQHATSSLSPINIHTPTYPPLATGSCNQITVFLSFST